MAEARETEEIVQVALSCMSEKQRAALLLSRHHGLSYQEIAGAMGLRVGAVKSLIHRATETLRKSRTLIFGIVLRRSREMRCNKARKYLTALLDGESKKSFGRLQEHLAGCKACRSERKTLQRVRGAMERMEMPEYEPFVSPEAVLDQVGSEHRDSVERRRRDRGRSLLGVPLVGLRPAIALATGMAVIALVWLVPFLRSSRSPPNRRSSW